MTTTPPTVSTTVGTKTRHASHISKLIGQFNESTTASPAAAAPILQPASSAPTTATNSPNLTSRSLSTSSNTSPYERNTSIDRGSNPARASGGGNAGSGGGGVSALIAMLSPSNSRIDRRVSAPTLRSSSSSASTTGPANNSPPISTRSIQITPTNGKDTNNTKSPPTTLTTVSTTSPSVRSASMITTTNTTSPPIQPQPSPIHRTNSLSRKDESETNNIHLTTPLSGTATIRQKLQAFRTLPMNFPSTNTPTGNRFEEKTNEGPMSMRHSVNAASPASSVSSIASIPLSYGHMISPPPTNSLSPTHFSYWEKRNIWVQREQEEMRAKVNLKKVLRKINDSNLIVRQLNKWGSPVLKSVSPDVKGPVDSSPLLASKSVSPPVLALPTAGVRAVSLPPPLPTSVIKKIDSTTKPTSGSGSPVLGGISLPSPQLPAITITELSTAANNLNLTGHLGRVEFIKDCSVHLNKMESHSCQFISAPQLMWALKALTLTEDEAVRETTKTGSSLGTTKSVGSTPPDASLSPSSYQSLSQLTASEIFSRKRAAIENIISEQKFTPNVVQYIRTHTLLPPTITASATLASRPLPPPPVPPFPGALRSASVSVPSTAPTTSPTSTSTNAVKSPPTTRHTIAHPPNTKLPTSTTSSRSNSQTELDHEWSRRRIPRVKLKTITQKIDAKLKDEEEELEERRKMIVEKMLSLNIWEGSGSGSGQHPANAANGTTSITKPSEEEILSSLSQHRFDLLRFTFELTELQEMEGRYIRFKNVQQAMSALRILYDPFSATQISQLCSEQKLPSHVQAYLEARRQEIMNSRQEHPTITKKEFHRGGLNIATGSDDNNHIATPLSPTASPLTHHRSISLLEFVEVLSAGNLMANTVNGRSDPTCTPESLSFLLTDVGLDLNEVSIDDLIQFQQHPSLAKSFATPKQVVMALELLYTDYREQEIIERCNKEGLDPKVRNYLIQVQQSYQSMKEQLITESSLQPIVMDMGGGKKSQVDRKRRKQELHAKVVQYELQSMDVDIDMEEAEIVTNPVAKTAAQAKYTAYCLQHGDFDMQLARDRITRDPAKAKTSASDLHKALNVVEFQDLCPMPVSLKEIETCIMELNLHLDEGEIDLTDLNRLNKDGVKFKSVKEALQVMYLLNLDCEPEEFEELKSKLSVNPSIQMYLETHARVPLADIIYQQSQPSTSGERSAAAKYALLEYDAQQELEMEYMVETDAIAEGDEAQIEYGSDGTIVAKPSYAALEFQVDDEQILNEEVLATDETQLLQSSAIASTTVLTIPTASDDLTSELTETPSPPPPPPPPFIPPSHNTNAVSASSINLSSPASANSLLLDPQASDLSLSSKGSKSFHIPPPPPPLPSNSNTKPTTPPPTDLDDSHAALVASHIRDSSHFKPLKPIGGSEDQEQPPIQETEPPVATGCCSGVACVIM